jgi:hypothetical protein
MPLHPRTLLPLSLILLPSLLSAQGAPIVIDGGFADWTPGLATFTDNNAPTTGIDLLSMQVTNDDKHLYIRLTVGSEIDLLDDLVPQTIRLYIDGDNNPSTGTAVQTGYGAEVQVRFDTRTVTEYFGASSNVSWSTLDLVPLPTVTATGFEIAIARTAKPDGVNDLFNGGTCRILFRETDGGDAMPNSGTTFSYTFDNTFAPAPDPIDVARLQPQHVRITAWNVLGDGITNSALQGPFQRLLTALAPDVIGFSECVTSTAAQVKTRLDSWLPIGGAGWYVVKDDFDMVIASRWPILQSWPGLSRQFPALIDLPATYATDLLFTAAHLNCCTADATRQAQCDAYVQFVQDAKSPGGVVTVPAGTPMVYAGDLNTVGWAQQLTTLIAGDIQDNVTYGPDGAMDWDGSGLARAGCRQTDAHMAYTWRNTASAYPSGLLDHLLYTDAVAPLAKSFTLRTAVMPPATLAALGLQSGDATAASDHLPITADLNVPLAGVKLQVRAFLEGPFNAATTLMHDSLRTKGLIPAAEPYTGLGLPGVNGSGGEIVAPGVLSVAGNDAIVDWVQVELRSPLAPTVPFATRCALLQRDGDVVATDGSSPVNFAMPAGTYHVVLRHRNHLDVMTAAGVALTASPVTVDLTTNSTTTYGSGATKTMSGKQVLWAGNALRDGTLRYTGTNNDRDPVLVAIGGSVPTAFNSGYRQEDVNLDGVVKYTGPQNDRDPVLVNIGGALPTATRAEQLP